MDKDQEPTTSQANTETPNNLKRKREDKVPDPTPEIENESRRFPMRPLIEWGGDNMRLSGVPKIPSRVLGNYRLGRICIEMKAGLRKVEDATEDIKHAVDDFVFPITKHRPEDLQKELTAMKETVLYAKYATIACYHEVKAIEEQMKTRERVWKQELQKMINKRRQKKTSAHNRIVGTLHDWSHGEWIPLRGTIGRNTGTLRDAMEQFSSHVKNAHQSLTSYHTVLQVADHFGELESEVKTQPEDTNNQNSQEPEILGEHTIQTEPE